MTNIEAIIIDDELNNIKILKHFLEKYCPMIKVLATSNSKNEAISLIQNLKPQLLFLDIVLDEGTGFDILEEIHDFKGSVIFVTAFNEYAVKAFKHGALDYIVKPIIIEELISAVHKAQNKVLKNNYFSRDQLKSLINVLEMEPGNDIAEDDTQETLDNEIDILDPLLEEYPEIIAIPSIKKINLVGIDRIEFLEADGKYTIFHLKNKDVMVASRNIGEYLKILNPQLFFRVHHTYVVNMNAIKNIHKTDGNYCELNSGFNIPIAKRRLEEFNKFLRIK